MKGFWSAPSRTQKLVLKIWNGHCPQVTLHIYNSLQCSKTTPCNALQLSAVGHTLQLLSVLCNFMHYPYPTYLREIFTNSIYPIIIMFHTCSTPATSHLTFFNRAISITASLLATWTPHFSLHPKSSQWQVNNRTVSSISWGRIGWAWERAPCSHNFGQIGLYLEVASFANFVEVFILAVINSYMALESSALEEAMIRCVSSANFSLLFCALKGWSPNVLNTNTDGPTCLPVLRYHWKVRQANQKRGWSDRPQSCPTAEAVWVCWIDRSDG